MSNRLALINSLKGSPILEERFVVEEVINCDPATGDHISGKGCLSVLFKGTDNKTGNRIAIKFFDPDFNGFDRSYREKLFEREVELLDKVFNKKRCLQKVSDIFSHSISAKDPSSGTWTFECFYFVIEWLEEGIDEYFYQQENYETDMKLCLFRNMALSVFSMHDDDIFHRDLKSDNFRKALRKNNELVVAIDYGTAARLDSKNLGNMTNYDHSPGTPMVAPLEAHCGLSWIRNIGKHYDYYALGCLLYDLFNIEHFAEAISRDLGFARAYAHCRTAMLAKIGAVKYKTVEEVLDDWTVLLSPYKAGVSIPDILGSGGSVPLSIRGHLNKLLSELTAIDFRDRLRDKNKIIRKIDICVKIIENSIKEKHRRKQKIIMKQNHEVKLLERQDKARKYLETDTE